MAARVLILSPTTISAQMSGPAIRYWEFAKHLADEAPVTLASPESAFSVDSKLPFEFTSYNHSSLPKLLQEHEIVLVQGFLLADYPEIAETARYLIVDLYDPYPLEDLALIPPSSLGKQLYRSTLASLLVQILEGDFFICASDRQRDFWLGVLLAMGRVNPAIYKQDKTANRLIEIVPFGIPSHPPEKTEQVIKGVIPGINAEDKVLLWGGGIHQWLDPLTPIRAMKEIAEIRNDVKLFFMGRANIASDRTNSIAQSALNLAAELALENRFVFFSSEWVPYEQRANYLLDADIGISTHPDHLETRFSFRTRILDYIWAGLPVIATSGDATSDLISSHQLGKIIAPESVRQFCDAVTSLLSEQDYPEIYRKRSRNVAQDFQWRNVIKPLKRFCSDPSRAPDKQFYGKAFSRTLKRNLLKDKSLLSAGWHSFREEGWEAFLHRAKSYLTRKAKR